MKQPVYFALLAFFSLFLVSAMLLRADAHEGATGVVKERMDLMKQVGKDMKSLSKMFKGEEEYDQSRVETLASEVESRSGRSLTDLFPEGSIFGPSEALDEIWKEWPSFEKSAEEMREAATLLKSSASKGRDEARTAFGKVANTCKACHDKFKED